MITIQEAIQLIASQAVTRKEQIIPVSESLNHYLAKPIIANIDLPSFDNSAMDGYAICGDGPEYQVVGEIQAGDTARYQLETGQAYRIFTGAKVPDNCLAVIMQEKTVVNNDLVSIEDDIKEGKNIRRRGEQVKKGIEIFTKGQKINPSVIGLMSSFGFSSVEVFHKPIINLLTTGNELIQPGEPLKEGQLYEANSNTLRSTLSSFGFSAGHQHVKDDYESTRKMIGQQLENTDVLLISGGISVGDYDFVKRALEENGVKEIFYKVYQKPGKPLYFGKKEDSFVFGLPGNPASSLVCLFIYVLPLIQKLTGANEAKPDWVFLPMAKSFKMPFDRPSFLKAQMTAEGVIMLDGQGSSMLRSMAKGNALALLEPKKDYRQGELVRCIAIN